MTNNSFYLFYLICGLLTLLIVETLYLHTNKSMNSKLLNKKITFVKITQLPDLAISTETSYIRHRSLTDIFTIYKDDAVLREYFPSTFTYSITK
jgi:hypothetical protein